MEDRPHGDFCASDPVAPMRGEDRALEIKGSEESEAFAGTPAQRIGLAWSLRLTGQVTALSRRQCWVQIPQGSPYIPDWCNGSTPDSDSGGRGSNP